MYVLCTMYFGMGFFHTVSTHLYIFVLFSSQCFLVVIVFGFVLICLVTFSGFENDLSHESQLCYCCFVHSSKMSFYVSFSARSIFANITFMLFDAFMNSFYVLIKFFTTLALLWYVFSYVSLSGNWFQMYFHNDGTCSFFSFHVSL